MGAHRCLAQACVAAGAFEQAERLVDRGLALGPDAGLLDLRGDALAGQGRSEDALATWSRAYALHAEDLSPRYSRACLLDRLGRHEETIAEWQAIIDWSRERGNHGDIAWPK